jgi:D-glycero-alpha-D-manno-heptose-7-phosphate kinase
MIRSVTASAPTRVDFAGGTLDIYPLYLFFNGGKTINAAIDLDAKVWLTGRTDDRIVIRSRDTGATLDWDGPADSLPGDGPLALITRVLRYYRPAGGLTVETQLLPPHGSGLGASSALFVALSHAVLAYIDPTKPRDPERIIRLSNVLEAQLMGLPAGMQDYYPPTYGGLCAVHYDLEGVWVEALDPDGSLLPELQHNLIVSYTNITHHSGTTNWSYMRNFFDGVASTREALGHIKQVAEGFYSAFKARDLREIGRLLDEEWQLRRGLSDEVTTPAIDTMMIATRQAGAWANKLCGAGGGGCMLTLAPPEAHTAVIAALEATGATHLNAHLVPHGVEVQVTEE